YICLFIVRILSKYTGNVFFYKKNDIFVGLVISQVILMQSKLASNDVFLKRKTTRLTDPLLILFYELSGEN
ncbi:hypothetical protein ACFL5D_05185, partial [Candidatus Neomarinimicrobiota bacterium]